MLPLLVTLTVSMCVTARCGAGFRAGYLLSYQRASSCGQAAALGHSFQQAAGSWRFPGQHREASCAGDLAVAASLMPMMLANAATKLPTMITGLPYRIYDVAAEQNAQHSCSWHGFTCDLAKMEGSVNTECDHRAQVMQQQQSQLLRRRLIRQALMRR